MASCSSIGPEVRRRQKLMKAAQTNPVAVKHFQVNFRTESYCACGDEEDDELNDELNHDLSGKRSSSSSSSGKRSSSSSSSNQPPSKKLKLNHASSGKTKSSSSSPNKSSNTKLNALLQQTVAPTRIYRSREEQEQIRQYLLDVHSHHTDSEKADSAPPVPPQCVLDRFKSPKRKHLFSNRARRNESS